jgi:hypothetical protein
MTQRSKKSRIAAGATLILVGLALFWIQSVENLGAAMTLFAIGALFVAGYLYGRNFGLLIPGCILLGLGSARVLDTRWPALDQPQFGLGLGFLAIYAIALLYERRSHWWPLIPGVILILVGLSAREELLRYFFTRGWPLILVAIGVVILIGGLARSGRAAQGE